MTNHYKFRILLGFLLASFIIYNRLFRHRQERLLYTSYDFWKLCFYIFICCVMIFLCINNILIFYRWVKNIDAKQSTHTWVIFIKSLRYNITKPFKYIMDNLEIFDTYLKNNTPYYDEEYETKYADIIIKKIGLYVEKHHKVFLPLGLIIIVVCQSIVLLSFCFDIIFLGKLYYFYKVLWILIIPLIVQYIPYSIRIYVQANLEELNKHIHIYISDDEGVPQQRISLQYHALVLKAYSENPEGKEIYFIHTLSPESIKEQNMDNMAIVDTIIYYKPIIAQLCRLIFFVDHWEYARKNYLSPFNVIKYFTYINCWLYLTYLIS